LFERECLAAGYGIVLLCKFLLFMRKNRLTSTTPPKVSKLLSVVINESLTVKPDPAVKHALSNKQKIS
jgi:hypothetical protein